MNYTSSVTYDGSGRPETLTYPSGFAVRNGYNARGYLASVAEEGGATVFWRADAVNAEGQVTQETFGNGVVTTNAFDPRTGLIDTISTDLAGTVIQDLAYDFDAIGNLKQRADLREDRQEDFLYDGLNRLTTTTQVDTAPGGGTLASTTYTYDALGNLKTKSDVGTYGYGGAGDGPHAVTSAGGETYAYDLNGNMTSGAGRTLAYASFNKPTLIAETASGDEAGFVYGPDRARIKQQVVDGGLARSVVYVGGLYERRTQFGRPDELVHYITAGTTVAIHTINDDGLAATNKARYLHRDHLGSIESITGETGAVVQRLSFDAHGKRRLADWTAGDPAAPGAETPRGFTGHEHLDSVGLIHMNGRVYDPVLGRFLSADPIVPNPTATQSFNRYSYVNNNPLSYTDPTGFWGLGDVADAVGDAIGAIGDAIGDAIGAIGDAIGDVANDRGWFDGLKDFFTENPIGRAIAGAVLGAAAGFATAGPAGVAPGALAGLMRGGFFAGLSGLFGQATNGGAPSTESYNDGREGNDRRPRVSQDQIEDFRSNDPRPVDNLWNSNFPDTVRLAQARYRALQARVENEALRDPDAEIELSQNDIETIAEMMSLRANMVEAKPFLHTEMIDHFHTADTFLWGNQIVPTLAIRKFYVPHIDRVVYGGDVNYIAVGAMAGRYGYSSKTLSQMGSVWNHGQYYTGKGEHNLKQIETGGFWAQYGRTYYKRRRNPL